MKFSHVIVFAIAATGGWLAARKFPDMAHTRDGQPEQKSMISQCPMHPWVNSDKPGDCTICGMNLVAVHAGENHRSHSLDGIVMLPPGSPNILGVQVSEVRMQGLTRTLKVCGMVEEDASRHGVISAPVEGRIDGLAMNHEGQPISKRQPIASIFSRTLLSAANDYKVALQTDGPDLEKARLKLQQYGLVAEQIDAIPQRQPDDLYFGILSPLTGTIVKSYVNEGQYLQAGDKMFEIADFTHMWCMFTVYEKDLLLVHERQVVRLRVQSLPGEEFNARVGLISPNLDEATRSAHVRVVLENPERRLKNKTYAEGIIELDAAEVIAVPQSAVLWPGGTPRVYVQHSPGAFERREVKLGRCGDAMWEVIAGLTEGEQVVTSGNMLIHGQTQFESFTRDSRTEAKQ